MTESTAEPNCSTCGGEMMSRDGQAFCPACLLQQGMQASSLGGNAALQNWTPPAIDQVALRFPNLEIESLIGQGGMGAVYKVRQTELSRPAALKLLPEAVATDPTFAERFLREARLLASLSHPHIVTVYEFGQREGLYFLLMEYVDGVTLRQASLAGPIKRLAPKEGLAVVGQLCDALQFAHDEGVVHRDIKPENILIDKRGRVKIADFGLAKLLGKPADLPTLTKTHQLMGTPTYMAPEQIEGQPVIDHRADIYSLGVVFYELLTGELPLGRFPPPSAKVDLDARLDEVVFRTLEKEPDRRYQQASDVRTDMDAIRTEALAATNEAARPNQSRSFGHGARLLIVCWSFIGTTMALYYLSLTNTLQRVAIGVAVAAVVAVLLQAFRTQSKAWAWSRLATGFILGVILPAVLLSAAIRRMEIDLNEQTQLAWNQYKQAEISIQQLNQKLNAAAGTGTVSGGGMDMGSYDAGGDSSAGSGDDMYGGSLDEGSFAYMAGSAVVIQIENSNVRLTGMDTLSPEKISTVNRILTDVHQKYLQLEADHSVVTVGDDGAVVTTICSFPREWQRLEDELWTRLDDAADIEQQRLLRLHLPLTDENRSSDSMSAMTGGGYPGAAGGMKFGMGGGGKSVASQSLPGLLGWAQPEQHSAVIKQVLAEVRIRRKGRWFEWLLPGQQTFQSGPQLPPQLRRFHREVGPATAIENARTAYARKDWKTLIDCFTHTGRFDWSFAQSKSLQPLIAEYNFGDTLHAELQHPIFAKLLAAPEGQYAAGSQNQIFGQQSQSIYNAVMEHSTYESRLKEMTDQLVMLSENGSAYVFINAVVLVRILDRTDAKHFILSRDFRFTCQPPGGDTAEGMLTFADNSEAPVRFRLVNNNWKIDAILTPETSILMMKVDATDKSSAGPPAAAIPETDDSAADDSAKKAGKPEALVSEDPQDST